MIPQEIIEGNKLIADFMGGKKFNYNITNAEYYIGLIHCRHCLTVHLEYNSSWDWLMPVVEKISKIKCMWDNAEPDESDTYYPRTFGMLNSYTKKPMVRLNSNRVFEADTLIEATWLAVIDFLKWYNQNKQS